MNPCPNNRRLIAWLAADALDVATECQLRGHLNECDGCRQYFAQISSITHKLTSAMPGAELQTSEAFHQKLMARLEAEKSTPFWIIIANHLGSAIRRWQTVVPLVATLGLVVFGISIFSPDRLRAPKLISAQPKSSNLDATMSHYQAVANQSLEALDDLLTRQANRPTTSTPIYTASDIGQALSWE